MKFFEVLLVFFRLGLTSFGGPVAHLGYFHDEFVSKRKWINEHAYADLVALCQFLPGPASSQVGMAIGLSRAGILGAVCAWIGFTLPSAIALVLFGLGITQFEGLNQGWLHGLKVVAVAVVAQAVLGLGRKLCPDKERVTLAIIASIIVLMTNSAAIQILILIAAGVFGAFYFQTSSELPHVRMQSGLRRRAGALFLFTFAGILVFLPVIRAVYPEQWLKLFDGFYRAGSLVFGGGHVVLPLLQAEVVPTGWVSNDLFMAGYGMAQAIPGPLFSFSAYLGAVSGTWPNGWAGALLCLVSIFLPSFLLIAGALPFWEKLRSLPKVRQALIGVNAAVVGILLAALYDPVWTSAIFSPKDFALAAGGLLLLEFWKLPSWAVVLATVAVSFLIY